MTEAANVFAAPGVRIERHRTRVGKPPDVAISISYTAWKPHASVHCREPSEVLRFLRWPAKTPTGDAIRAWLAATDAPELEPNADTRTIT